MGQFITKLIEMLGFAPDKTATLVVVGLDNAGKTTLLTKLSTGKLNSSLPPTQRATDETFRLGNNTFNAWDLGGHEAVRHLWSDYSSRADGIVYMIDATDKRRFQESGEELENLILDLAEATKKDVLVSECPTPIAVLLNKYDVDGAAPMESVVLGIELEAILEGWDVEDVAPPPIEVFSCSVIENRGYQKAFQWLSSQIP